jgi:hypothetical protein
MSLSVLDTDTLTLLQLQNANVVARVRQNWANVATTVISVEEQLRAPFMMIGSGRGDSGA